MQTTLFILAACCALSCAGDNNNNTPAATSGGTLLPDTTTTTSENDAAAFAAAMETVFAMQSGASPVSAHAASRRTLSNLMRRQSISQRLAELRALSDTDLFRLAQLAAVGGASRWTRDDASNLILLTKEGQMTHPYSPGAVESDVMLCVICALLTVIAIHHVVLRPSTPPPPLALKTATAIIDNSFASNLPTNAPNGERM